MHESFFHEFVGHRVRGGFTIVRLRVTDALLADALGREANLDRVLQFYGF